MLSRTKPRFHDRVLFGSRLGRVAAATAFVVGGLIVHASAASYLTYGKGSDTCDKVTAATQGAPLGKIAMLKRPGGDFFGESALYAEWIQGYISALNGLNSGGSRQIALDWDETDRWIREWCGAHPASKLEEATGTFVVTHLPPVVR